jgi:hypothetical protein
MLFQVLDNKKECYGVYHSGDIYRYYGGEDLEATWEYTSHFDKQNIEYAQIWCGGKTLEEACPNHLKDDWTRIQTKGKAYYNSFRESKVNLSDVCFYDLVPKRFLVEYCRLKTEITEYVLGHYKKPANYEFMLSLTRLTHDIKKQCLNIDTTCLNLGDVKGRNFNRKLDNIERIINYNPWGTVTGRLTTFPNSFPILTLNKDFRNVLKPNNDWFVEFDFNAAELRVFLALLDLPQPKGDIHSWIGKSVFGDTLDRDAVKKKTFAWLYNPRATNKKLEKVFDKEKMLQKYYFDGKIETPFHRTIDTTDDKALNYIIQSSTSDLFLRQMISVARQLEKRNTTIAFSIHDSLVLDFSNEDRDILVSLARCFAQTQLGDFKVNISAGRDFGNMKKMEL